MNIGITYIEKTSTLIEYGLHERRTRVKTYRKFPSLHEISRRQQRSYIFGGCLCFLRFGVYSVLLQSFLGDSKVRQRGI